MIKQQLTVINQLGLHARAAAKLVSTASGFSSTICITANEHKVDAKSIMGIMMLAATCGTTVEITASGEDENAAMLAIEELFTEYFDEGG
ncbi:MAG TPA: HPr family phosphocarrier protein [Gammaproteobacteria bacterium]|nr:HPr family phosphocarrier protein [Gammaproteobacteria bacterium]